ncbi:S49 family peptidase [Agrobacterium tumefaciens]
MSRNFLPLLADRILNRPLLIHPDKAATIMHVLDGRISLGSFDDDDRKPEASRFVGTTARGDGTGRRFTRAAGKTAIITVDGSLVNRGAWIGASSGLTSYEGIAAQLDEIAVEAKAGRLENLVIDMNSYGGEATGMAAVAAKIRNLRKSMHVVAVVNDVAASAGYGIVSSADEIVISPTSLVGSIGVVMMHLDRSAEMNAKGIRPTLIHAGAKKVDGNPFGPLPENVRADMQKDVLAFYDQFLETVEAGRGKARLSAKKARETEADVFIGKEAIAAGLADRMASLDEVLAELSRPARAAGKPPSSRSMKMEREDLPSATAGMHTTTALNAAVSKAEADGKTVGIIEGKKEGHAEGVKAERERIGSILNSEEGKARPNAALTLALAADSPSAETAKGLLASLPAENVSAAGGAAQPGAKTPPISQRADEQREVGATGKPEGASPEAARKGWAKAFGTSV